MKRTDLTFDSRDGVSKIHAVRWEPDDGAPKMILQIVHGMAEYIDRYEDFASYLTQNGVLVVGDDHLGHGQSITDGKMGYFCKQDPATVVVRDVHRLKKLTQEAYPGIPYFIMGHSMGSFIFRNYMCKYGKGITGAIVMGTGMQPKALVASLRAMAGIACFFGNDAKPNNFINNASFGTYLKRIENPRTPNDWLTKDEAIVDKYNADPLCGFVFPSNGFKTLAELIWRLTKKSNLEAMPKELPVFIVSGAEDPVGEYGKGPRLVYESYKDLGMKDVELKLYENDRHEILNETDRAQVYSDILEWVKKHA